VRDWKFFYDEGGQLMRCNEENKIRAMREIDGLEEFVRASAEQLAKDIAGEKEAAEKN